MRHVILIVVDSTRRMCDHKTRATSGGYA